MLKDVEAKFRATLPHQDGILLRPAIVNTLSKKISQKYKKLRQRSLKYSSLALHLKALHKKKDWCFRNRVGSKALRHKKVEILQVHNVYYITIVWIAEEISKAQKQFIHSVKTQSQPLKQPSSDVQTVNTSMHNTTDYSRQL